jgi:hypothetical protein
MPLYLDILDVGQGDGMVVWLPNNKVMMVDLGSTKNKGIVSKDSFTYFRDHTAFKDKGQVLDWLVLTHGDRDHFNMVEDFLAAFGVNLRNVLHGGLESDYGGLIGRLRNRKNPDGKPTLIHTGTDKPFCPLAPTDELGAEVVMVASGVEASTKSPAYAKNTRSVVLRIVYQGIGMLLTGDATMETEGQIIGLFNKKLFPSDGIQSNLLKVAHHGSHRTSNHAIFIHYVNPNFAFISSDRSGSLVDEQKATGHRLPQALTISLLRKYATRLQKDCGIHSYVMSYQKTDFEEYNRDPDIPGQTLDLPVSDKDLAWVEVPTTEGIFSTLAIMGLGTQASDDGSKDIGVQYRVSISDNADFDILSTEEFAKFNKVGALKK